MKSLIAPKGMTDIPLACSTDLVMDVDMDTAISAIKQRVAVQVAAVRDIVQQPPFSILAVGTVVAELTINALVIGLIVWVTGPMSALGCFALYTTNYLLMLRKKSAEQLGHGKHHCPSHHHNHHCGHCYHGGNGGHGGHW